MMEMSAVESRPGRPRQPDRRSALLNTLRASDRPMSVEEAAAAVGVAASTAQFHLALLVSGGLAKRTQVRSGAAGRPSWGYAPAAVEPSAVGAPEPYRELARVLAAQLGEEAGAAAAARQAGRRWAAEAPALDGGDTPGADDPAAAMTVILDRLGFAPEAGEDDEILLRSCPFEAVAREHRAVVCSVHLGLLERTASAVGGLVVDGLEPFRSEQPLTCAVRLRRRP
jgi:predicted ArsR family transcriptional regulator